MLNKHFVFLGIVMGLHARTFHDRTTHTLHGLLGVKDVEIGEASIMGQLLTIGALPPHKAQPSQQVSHQVQHEA